QQGQGQQGQGQQGGGQQPGGPGQRLQGPQFQPGEQTGGGSQGGAGTDTLRADSTGAQRGGTFESGRRQGANSDLLLPESMEALVNDLEGIGRNQQAGIDELRDLVDELRQGSPDEAGGAVQSARLQAEYEKALLLVEQLEIELAKSVTDAAGSGLTGSEADARPGEISESASDYYRRLSNGTRVTP
nr:hypothetical protein [Gammaproteobacteria bacterium]